MKTTTGLVIIILLFLSCDAGNSTGNKNNIGSLTGSWKLLSGTIVQNNDTTVTDYREGKSFIKIINESHFAFLLHDLEKGKDSSTAAFVAGGGKYELNDSLYTEHLEYCSDRKSEGLDFTFTILIKNDTLTQSGFEKNAATGVTVFNTEKYVRLKQ